jgi:hypothetical protein
MVFIDFSAHNDIIVAGGDYMAITISILGFLALIGCIVWLIVSLIRKRPKKNSLIGMLIAFVVFVGAGIVSGQQTNSVPTSKSQSSSSAAISEQASSTATSSAEPGSSVAPVSSLPPVSSEKSVAEIRKQAKNISYKLLARYPDKYKDQTIKFSGKVVQSLDESGTFTLRVAQDSDYDKMFLVSYVPTNDARILEDDIITVYGIYSGVQSYQSTLGGTITIPYAVTTDVVIK